MSNYEFKMDYTQLCAAVESLWLRKYHTTFGPKTTGIRPDTRATKALTQKALIKQQRKQTTSWKNKK